MVEHLPEWKTIGITILLTLIPAAISTGFEFSLIKNPEIQITVLENKDYQKSISSIHTIIQNIGNIQEENITVVYSSPFNYSLNSFNSTESKPKIFDTDEVLRISIDRISPRSYIILDVEGIFQTNSSKVVYLTTKNKMESLVLNNTVNNIGITNINFKDKINNPLIIEGLIGGIVFASYRFFSIRKYESVRKKFIGVYKLNRKKHTLTFYFIGFFVLYIVGYAASFYDMSENHLAQRFPSPYIDYFIDDSITPNQFLEFKDLAIFFQATNGNLIFAVGIFFLLLYTKAQVLLPTTYWLRPIPYSKITLKMIPNFYTPSKTVSKNTRMKILEDGIDIYAIRENNKIIGLISQSEISKLGFIKTKLGAILQNKKLGTPRWNQEKEIRENFLVINENETLEIVKKKMDEEGKQFLIIVDNRKGFKGVLDYDSVFEHKLFSKKV